ncbi:transcriptional regulator [Opitutaceae bacterium TAV5]|nr:transcriptional regulator [Opitutaceae bacterium TAV5]
MFPMLTESQKKADFVFTELERRIAEGVWKIGEQIPTEAELAEEFSCSRGTVSRAIARLSHEKLVERRTRAGTRVVQRPQTGAHSRNGGAHALDLDACACIYPSVEHEGIAMIVQGFQSAANEARQRVMMLTTGMNFRKEAEIVGRLGEFNVRGAVIYPVIRSPQDQVYYMQMILACPYPVVMVGVNLPGVNRPGVVSDGQHAAYTMTRRLLDQGLRRIGYLSNYAWVPSTRDRYLGYRQAMSEAGVFDDSLAHLESRMQPRFDNPLEEPTQIARDFFDRMWTRHPGGLEAIVCAEDFLAHGCITAATERGLRVSTASGDLKVTGIGGFRNLPRLDLPLTTYRMPFSHMGATAFRVLNEQIAGRYDGPLETILRGEPVPGGTA